MEQFLQVQGEVMRAFLSPMGAVPESHPRTQAIEDSGMIQKPRTAWPFIGEILSHEPGRALLARRCVDAAEDLFLEDHALGGTVSISDPSLCALSLMPFTMTMEMAAEAAAVLAPDLKVIGLREVRANRWIALEEGPVALEIAARREKEDSVHVTIREADPEGRPASPILEAHVLLAEDYPPPPAPASFEPQDSRVSRWTPERIYREGMFHGPRFQGVACVERWGKDGVVARLRALPQDALVRATPTPAFLIDPILADAAGQLVGFWHAEANVLGFNVFPFSLAALSIYGAPLAHPAQGHCRARIARAGDHHLRADIEVMDGEGRLHLALHGWEDRAFDLPAPLCRLTCASRGLTLSEPWPAATAHLEKTGLFHARRAQIEGSAEGQGILWQIAAQLLLSRAERAAWSELRRPGRKRNEWLLGRAAAKDAVCALLRERHGVDVLPADVEVAADPLGRPVVGGAWTAKLVGAPPSVAIAHDDGLAVAVASDAEYDVGIDLERMRDLPEGFDDVAFSAEEAGLLSGVPEKLRGEWRLRAWCAKEAAAKAMGTGLAWRPRDLVARKFDSSTGTIAIEIGGEPARLRPDFAGRILEVHTFREESIVAAVIACRRSET
jgi:phosphopantetheinyl transferase